MKKRLLNRLFTVLFIVQLIIGMSVQLSADPLDVTNVELTKGVTGYTYYHNFLLNTLMKSGYYVTVDDAAAVLKKVDENFQSYAPEVYEAVISRYPRTYDPTPYDKIVGWDGNLIWAPPELEMSAEMQTEWYMKHVHGGFIYPELPKDAQTLYWRKEIIMMLNIHFDASNGRITVEMGEYVDPTAYTELQAHMVSPNVYTPSENIKAYRNYAGEHNGETVQVSDYKIDIKLANGIVQTNYWRMVSTIKTVEPIVGGHRLNWSFKLQRIVGGVPNKYEEDGSPLISSSKFGNHPYTYHGTTSYGTGWQTEDELLEDMLKFHPMLHLYYSGTDIFMGVGLRYKWGGYYYVGSVVVKSFLQGYLNQSVMKQSLSGSTDYIMGYYTYGEDDMGDMELILVPWDSSHAYFPSDTPDDVEGIEWGDIYVPPEMEDFPSIDIRLTQKFPFSIPWDIGRLLSVFYAPPAPPRWQFDLPAGEFTYPIDINLGEYEKYANISRWFFRISWAVALMFLTFKVFGRGS